MFHKILESIWTLEMIKPNSVLQMNKVKFDTGYCKIRSRVSQGVVV